MLSIIIPTLNAEATLPQVLSCCSDAHDMLIVDGGSTDTTTRIATDFGAQVVMSEPGRGRQLALGADHAKTSWMLFLHADTRLPKDWQADVERFISQKRNQGLAAYFRLAFDSTGGGAHRVAALANWRAQTLGLPYGDQGLLIHKDLYNQVGGYRTDQNLMEDVDLVRRIGPMRLKPLRATITTSATKYHRDGWWGRPLTNLTCLTLYLLGARQSWIERLYR